MRPSSSAMATPMLMASHRSSRSPAQAALNAGCSARVSATARSRKAVTVIRASRARSLLTAATTSRSASISISVDR